jgi:hypothetical protein
MTRRFWAKVLVLAAATAVSLGVAEGFVRVRFPYSKDSAIPGNAFAVDDLLGWKFRPGARSIHRTRYFTVEYVIDGSGFRDRAKVEPETSPQRRIAVYGDSLVFGWGVPESDRFTDLLDARDDGLQVWNRGVPGYGLDQQVLSYTSGTGSTRFDEATFLVSSSTLGRMRENYIYAKYKPMFVHDDALGLRLIPVPRMLNRGVNFFYGLLSPFYLPYFVQNRLSMMKLSSASIAARPTGASSEPRYVDSLSKKVLLRVRTTARERNQHVSVLVGDLGLTDREELRLFCEQNDVGFLQVPPEAAAALGSAHSTDLVLGPGDRHWNSKANRLIADELRAQLARR